MTAEAGRGILHKNSLLLCNKATQEEALNTLFSLCSNGMRDLHRQPIRLFVPPTTPRPAGTPQYAQVPTLLIGQKKSFAYAHHYSTETFKNKLYLMATVAKIADRYTVIRQGA